MKKGSDGDFEAYLRWRKRTNDDMEIYRNMGNATRAAFAAGWKAGKRHSKRKRKYPV
jgi:hypothetical protein